MSIQIHTFPQGQQLSDGELIQVQVHQSGRLIFKDAYFGELQVGDKYIIPEQVELPLASDTEILDFLVTEAERITWVNHVTESGASILVFKKDGLDTLAEAKYETDEHLLSNRRGAFREAFTEVIHNHCL